MSGVRSTITKDAAMSHGSSAREPASVSSTLLGRFARPDAQAWEQLTNIFGPLVYHWCRRAGLDCEDAADVFQETFRAVLAVCQDFAGSSRAAFIRGWRRSRETKSAIIFGIAKDGPRDRAAARSSCG